MFKKPVYLALFVLINLGFLLPAYEGQAQGVISLPWTGQSKCYDSSGSEIHCAGTGQDGELQVGIDWPDPRFTDHGNGTVTDNLTGLMWTQNANLPGGGITWQAALDYVAGMNAGTHQNFGDTDWRLPNVNELESLVNGGEADTAINSQGFVNVQSYVYWSSTTGAFDPVIAWGVDMCYGDVGHFNKSYYNFCVWPVRSGQSGTFVPSGIWKTGQTTSHASGDDGDLEKGVSWPSPRFMDHGNGTITDNLTGLMWSKNANPAGGTKTWQEALDYVKTLSTGGHSDWRLPNRKELFSLIDHSKFEEALPASHPFQNVQRLDYWSSTTYAYSTDRAWGVVMWSGSVLGNGKSYYHYVWPVRSTASSITVSKSGAGIGTVTSSPAGINCGDNCSETYNQGTSVTLTATPSFGSTFGGWSGGGCSGTGDCSITMDSDKTITAVFNLQQHSLTVIKSGTGSGTVTSNPAGINCGSDCSESYDPGTSVTLTATPASGSSFSGWSGSGCSGTGTCVAVMNVDIEVTAAFLAKPPAISVSPSSLDFGIVAVGKKTTKTLKITNNGSKNLIITISGLKRTDFSIQGSSSVTIKAKKSYSLKVLCKPTSGGLIPAILKIQTNDPDTPKVEISLTATLPATVPDISVVQTSIEFGSVKVGKKGTKTLKITNNGTGDLIITLSGLGTDFGIQGNSSVTIKPKKSYSLKVLFTPKSAGPKTATLRITSNDPDTPTIDIPLSGTGQ